MIGRVAIIAVSLPAVVGTSLAPAAAQGPAPVARPAVKAATPMIHAPASAHLGRQVHVTTSGLVRGRYALTLVADRRPARGAFCLARLATSTSRSTQPSFSARIPTRLRCYQGASTFLGRVPATPGAYHFVVGVPLAPSATDGRYSLVRAAVRVSR